MEADTKDEWDDEGTDKRILEGRKEEIREKHFKNRIMEQEKAGELGYTTALEHAKEKQYKDAGKDYVKLYQQKKKQCLSKILIYCCIMHICSAQKGSCCFHLICLMGMCT